jgi:hypothetical protein
MRRLALAATSVAFLASTALAQTPLGTSFTYQGRLVESGSPANGTYDFRFILYDAPAGGNQVGPIVTRDDVSVSTGLFTVGVDFGAVFGSQRRFLEVGVRPGASTGAYDVVSGRHELTAAPAALFGASAPWTGLTGKPAGFADDVDNDLLAGMACASGQVAKSTGSGWTCGTDLNTTYAQGPGITIAGNTVSVSSLGITAAMLADAAVSQAKLADNAVTTAKLVDGAVNGSKLSSNSVTLASMTDNSVGTLEIQNGAITSTKIASGAVLATHIANGVVQGTHVATGAIGTTQIAAGGVATADIADDAITRSKIGGSEVALYLIPGGCTNGGQMTTVSLQCFSLPCGGGAFYSCLGSCNQLTPQTCTPSLLGFLLSPSIP